MRLSVMVTLVTAVAILPAQPGAAQVQDTAATVRISGVIKALGTDTALASARVTLLSAARGTAPANVVTAEGGRFTLPPVRPGIHTLEIQKRGYRSIRDSIEVEAYHAYELHVEIVPEAVEKDPVVEVVPWRISPRIDEFDRRRQTGWGTYFTRQDIERIQPKLITDLLRRVPGVRVDPITRGVANDVTMKDGCTPALFVDDLLMTGMLGSDIDRQFSPDEVEGMEVYVGNTAPGRLHRNACGTIVIWSRTFQPGESSQSLSMRFLATAMAVSGGLILAGLFF